MVKLKGEVIVPGSKSHTIRALLLAALVEPTKGESILRSPLCSQDTLSAKKMVQQLGAEIHEEYQAPISSDAGEQDRKTVLWRVQGTPWRQIASPEPISIDVGNSGTALYLGTAMAALFQRPVRFDGDASIRKRSAGDLLAALKNLGVNTETRGHCPYLVRGPIQGGRTHLLAPTSQYLSALLLALPLTAAGVTSEIIVDQLNEHPYVDMTLEWLASCGAAWDSERYHRYIIRGGQEYRSFERDIPADFSSATFFFCAAAITGSTIRLRGLTPHDTQGDKQTLDFLQSMGCQYRWLEESGKQNREARGGVEEKLQEYVLEFTGPEDLCAAELDLAATPDALPALAVACACASGVSRLHNVAHARNKETDRIACMAQELQALGFAASENSDGLTICGGIQNFLHAVRQRKAQGYRDHRIIMALSLLNLLEPRDPVVLDDTSHAAVTFPSFFDDLQSLSYRG